MDTSEYLNYNWPLWWLNSTKHLELGDQLKLFLKATHILQHYWSNTMRKFALLWQDRITNYKNVFIQQNGGEYGSLWIHAEGCKAFKLIIADTYDSSLSDYHRCQWNCPRRTLENIQDHTAHFKNTSDKFYQLWPAKEAIKAQKTITDAQYFTSTQNKQILHELSLDKRCPHHFYVDL